MATLALLLINLSTINLSILDFKCERIVFIVLLSKAINLSILDFK